MPDSMKGNEEESRSPASVLNTSEMLDQSDKLKDEIVAEIGCLQATSLKQGDSLDSDACASTLSNEHEYNAEFDACVGCISGPSNDTLCEINGEPNSIHQEASLMMDNSADGRSNDMNSEAMKNLDASEEPGSKMIYSSGEWVAYWDDFHMSVYFYSVATQESTWDPPSGMEHLVYGNTADESISTVLNDEMDIQMLEEVQASCDLQLVHDLAKESTNDAHSLDQQLDEISGDWVSIDNVSSTNTMKKKTKAKKTKSKRKLSISSEGLHILCVFGFSFYFFPRQ